MEAVLNDNNTKCLGCTLTNAVLLKIDVMGDAMTKIRHTGIRETSLTVRFRHKHDLSDFARLKRSKV